MAEDRPKSPNPATRLAQPFKGPEWGGASRPVAPPLVQTSLYSFPDFASFDARMRGEGSAPPYSRISNTTVAEFEAMMADLEGGESAWATASGMAAITAAIVSQVRPGDHVIAVERVYNDTYRLLEQVLTQFGVSIAYHPLKAFETDESIYAGARLAWLESPTSMLFETLDLDKVAALAGQNGTVTAIDNSWATPLNQRPLAHGIDLVVHSASKYLGGHSDVVAGVVVGSAAMMQPIPTMIGPLFGAKLQPFEAWLLIRSLRTLDVRMRHIARASSTLIERLRAHPAVVAVHAADTAASPSLTGQSGLFSIELANADAAARFCDALRLFSIGPSWGGFESLVFPACAGGRTRDTSHALGRFGVPDGLVRLSIGLEDTDDLWADLNDALT